MADIEETVEKRGPGRPPRAQMERAERRRRRDTATTGSLDVPQDVADRLVAQGKQGRWINDLNNRMHDKTVNDDWDRVEGMEPRVVGTDKRTGDQIKAYYCAKPVAYIEEDAARHLDVLKERERAIARGDDGGELDKERGSYRPKSRNRIGNIEL